VTISTGISALHDRLCGREVLVLTEVGDGRDVESSVQVLGVVVGHVGKGADRSREDFVQSLALVGLVQVLGQVGGNGHVGLLRSEVECNGRSVNADL